MIDLRRFNSIKILKDGVYVGAGVHLNAIVRALGKYNLAIPMGTCGSVAVAGLALAVQGIPTAK